jgi:hypothetical protein
MNDPTAMRLALTVLLCVVAWTIAMVFIGNPEALLFACLLGVAAVLICPTPP